MAIQLASFLTPKTGASYFILEDVHLRGGMRVVSTESLRDLIPSTSRKSGMLVWTQDSRIMWQLQEDKISWVEFSQGQKHIALTVTEDSDTWNILHSFNTKLFLYNVFDEEQNVVIPQNVSSTLDTVTFSFSFPIKGQAIVQFLT